MLTSVASREIQSTSSSVDSILLGEMIEVINALSSFVNDSFLNPSATKANWPKFELEFVIEASPPVWASKCLVYPIANTETICRIASSVILIWLVSQPGRYIAPESKWYTFPTAVTEEPPDNSLPSTAL